MLIYPDTQVANLADIFTSRLLHEIPPALSALLEALLNLPSLHTVDLSDNAFGLNTQAPVVEFLSQHIPLRHLILNNNGLGPDAGTTIGNALTALHGKKEDARKENKDVPDLRTIICGRNRLENDSMEAWAKALAAHQGVEVVKMIQNGIRQDGIIHLLSQGLRHTSKLRVLDLQDNTFTRNGSYALGDVVGSWSEVEELGFGDCLLTARGTDELSRSLAEGNNKKLQIVRLQYNDMDTRALKAFKDAAEGALPALRRVELNGNLFSEDDASIDALRGLLSERRAAASVGENDEGAQDWGLDSLSDLEDEDDDDDDDEDDDTEDEDDDDDEQDEDKSKAAVDKKAERILKDADEAEGENVSLKADAVVDDLAKTLQKTGLS